MGELLRVPSVSVPQVLVVETLGGVRRSRHQQSIPAERPVGAKTYSIGAKRPLARTEGQ